MLSVKEKILEVFSGNISLFAYRDQHRIPTTDVEKNDLLQAGLGEKEIIFSDLNLSAEGFCITTFLSFKMLGYSNCANASLLSGT